MILSNVVNVKISNNQIKYYKEKGYDIIGGNEIKEIKVSDLPPNSGQKIRVECDFCGTQKLLSLNRYMINTKNKTLMYACCQKCMQDKVKNTCLEKYGVDNVSKLQEIKQKKIETCLINHNVEHPQQSNIIFSKGLETKLEKYGCENYNNSIKREETCLLKYGVPHAMQNTEISNKLRTNLQIFYKNKILSDKKYTSLYIQDFKTGEYEFKCDCDKEHNFKIDYKLLWQRLNSKSVLCTICNEIDRHTSGKEIQLFNFIKENYDGQIIENDRKILDGKELDIYLPDINLAFEFNGLYWHNELNKDKKYHLNKTEKCLKKHIELIHVWEDDWDYKNEIIKSMILNKLGKTTNKIFARKCEIKEIIDNELVKDFLNKNHLQGFVGSSVKIGLFYENKLVSVMTFGKKRKFMNSSSKEGEFELLRFCNKINTIVIGGASKLFNYFTNNYNFTEITTYADRSHSQGKLYKNLGFNLLHKTEPNYYYIINSIRKYRFGFRKDILVKEGYDPIKTEHQIMLERGINRIFDSGNLKFNYKKIK